MKTTRNLVYILATAFGVSFFYGLFDWQASDNLSIILGIIEFVCIIWLVFRVSQKNMG